MKMVPISPCNVPPAGIVGVLMRMEERSKALKEEVGRIVTHKVNGRNEMEFEQIRYANKMLFMKREGLLT